MPHVHAVALENAADIQIRVRRIADPCVKLVATMNVRTTITIVALSLIFCCGCSREGKPARSMFSGVWIGWFSPQEPNTSSLSWHVFAQQGVIVVTTTKETMRARDKIKFTVSEQAVDAHGRNSLVLQTDRGYWKIVFGKDGESFGVFGVGEQLVGGFKYVTDTHGLKPEDFTR